MSFSLYLSPSYVPMDVCISVWMPEAKCSQKCVGNGTCVCEEGFKLKPDAKNCEGKWDDFLLNFQLFLLRITHKHTPVVTSCNTWGLLHGCYDPRHYSLVRLPDFFFFYDKASLLIGANIHITW